MASQAAGLHPLHPFFRPRFPQYPILMKTFIDASHLLLGRGSTLAQVFTKYDDKLQSGFITRLDRTPVSRKRFIFVRSLVYNFVILAVSTTLVLAFISRRLSPNVPESVRLTLSVTQGLLLFWATSIFAVSTTIPFVFGECRVRWKYGFKPTEVIVRRSPPESCTATSHKTSVERRWRASLRAINPTLLYSNPGSILARDFWVMEYTMILDIYASLERGELDEEDLEFTIWKEYGVVWTGLEIWRLHCILSDQQEIALFKAFLTSKGKHELHSAWESLFDNAKHPAVQTPETYRSMIKRFSQEGIDYEAVWSQIQEPCVA